MALHADAVPLRVPAVTTRRPFIVVLFAFAAVPLPRADYSTTCEHEIYPEMARGSVELIEGATVSQKIDPNETHRYFFRSMNTTLMNLPERARYLILNLEPCRGTVYLFVRKTRRCYPNPYSCIDLASGIKNSLICEWTHFMSEIDGSRDGTPTLLEIPLTATKFYISVFAATGAEYTLMALTDIGAFPRPGNDGVLAAKQVRELEVQLTWTPAFYIPEGVTQTRQYWIYSSLLLETDNRTNLAVFLRPDKVMNTVCGLRNNTDKHYDRIPASQCLNGICNFTIVGVITDKRYVFNVVAESMRGQLYSYGGLVMRSQWTTVRQATDDKTLQVVGVVSGSVIAIVVILYFLMLKLYG